MVWNGSDPAVRFAVYRNNVMASLIDALADNCPVLHTQVGEDFFRAMAAEFIRHHPPLSPVLTYYGEGLAAWIATFPPLDDWPWLADLAALELAFITALHAADNKVGEERFPGEIDAGTMGLVLDSSLQAIHSSYAIYEIWSAHQAGAPVSGIAPYQPESVLLFRQRDDVMILPVSAAQAQFVSALLGGATLMQALKAGQRDDAAFDAENILIQLHHYDLIITCREGIC